MLYDEKLLTISTDGTQWEWNISSILKQKATDNVIDLMVQCINQLSEDAQNILKWISCLGNSVPLWKIELLLNIQRQELFSALIPAIEAGMAHIVDDCFQFAHDRVQEAVDSKILRKEKQSMHFKIGSILLKHINNIQDKFEVTDHLNKGVMESDIELSDEQLLEIMDLNLTVGTRAYQSVAFSFACNYSKCGVWYFSKQLYKSEDEAWRKQYTLGMSLYKLLANSYFVLNEYDHMSETIDLILKKSQNIVDTTEGYNLLVTYYTNIGDFQKAMEYGRAALELHNIIIPNDSGTLKNDLQAEKKKIVDRMDELRTSCGEIDITSLLIPPTPEQFVLLSLISTLGGTAYLAQSESFPLIMAKQVYNSLRHCITSESAIAFAFYTCDLISNEEYSSANEFSQLSVIVAEKYFPSKLNDRVKALHLYCVFAQHWFKTIRLTTSRSREIFKLAIGCGEIPYAGFSYTALCPAFLYTGYNILESLAEMDKCLEFSIKTKNQTAIGCVQSASLVLNRLSMQDAEEYAQLAVKLAPSSADVFNNTHYRVYSLMVDYMMDEEKYDDLSSYVTKQFKNIEELQEVTKCVKGLFAVVLFNVYSTLTTIRLMGLLGETKHELSARMLSFVESSMTQLKYWVDVCYKDNFLNKYLMISAELKSVQGDIWSAVNLYDESIAAAKENEFTHECALANELAAKCMIKGGKPQFAQVYLNSAFETYEQWGAYRKLDLLSDKYNGMISRINYSGFGKSSTTGKNKHRVNSLSSSLDIEGILRVSQTISSTIDMSELLVKIMKVIVETAGATSAAIIIDNQVEAEYYSQNITTSSIPLQSWKRGCVAVVEYVTRTRENIVLADASSDKKYGFGSNSYVMQSRAKSILCMPVTHQNELKAVLYCENSKINDCFTMDRITVLNILTNQIAISLENSKYFKIQLKAVQDLAEIQSQRASEEKTYRKKQEEFVDRQV
jgi:GAF domain-containing protein